MSNASRQIVDKAQNSAHALFFDACPAQEITDNLQTAFKSSSARLRPS